MTNQLNEQRQFASESKERVLRLNLALATFLLLALVDALIGGAISTRLQVAGWTARDQEVNNAYQLIYGMIVALTLVWLFFHTRSLRPILAVLVLYAGYVEDTLFYLLIPIVNPVLKLLNSGATFRTPTDSLFPERISGWVGWVGRLIWGQNVSFEMPVVFVMNTLAIGIVLLLLRRSN